MSEATEVELPSPEEQLKGYQNQYANALVHLGEVHFKRTINNKAYQEANSDLEGKEQELLKQLAEINQKAAELKKIEEK